MDASPVTYMHGNAIMLEAKTIAPSIIINQNITMALIKIQNSKIKYETA